MLNTMVRQCNSSVTGEKGEYSEGQKQVQRSDRAWHTEQKGAEDSSLPHFSSLSQQHDVCLIPISRKPSANGGTRATLYSKSFGSQQDWPPIRSIFQCPRIAMRRHPLGNGKRERSPDSFQGKHVVDRMCYLWGELLRESPAGLSPPLTCLSFSQWQSNTTMGAQSTG